MEKEEQLFLNRVCELAGMCYERDIPTNTDFLNLNEQTVLRNHSGILPPVRYELTGGFLASERKVLCFLPSYMEEAEPPFDCVRIAPKNPRFAEELTHRDYLGALMNLGIERSMIGDILIREGAAFVFLMKKMSAYVCENLPTVRHTTIEAQLFDFRQDSGELEPELLDVSGSVSSLRLDSIAALAARQSRSKASQLIAAEKVFLNGRAELSPSRLLKEGDILSIRGVGKFRFDGEETVTKKGRLFIKLFKYQ